MELIRKIFIILAIYIFFLIMLVLFLRNVISFDEYLFLVINNSTNPYLLEIFEVITYAGSSIFWIALIIISWAKNKRKLSLHLILAFVIDIISLTILKQIFMRPRPYVKFQNVDVDLFDVGPSFPSGHSQTVFSGAVILSNYYKKYILLFYILSIAVAFSRIYLGVHYPLDVLIGAINGIIIGMITLKIPTKKSI